MVSAVVGSGTREGVGGLLLVVRVGRVLFGLLQLLLLVVYVVAAMTGVGVRAAVDMRPPGVLCSLAHVRDAGNVIAREMALACVVRAGLVRAAGSVGFCII